MCDSVPLLYPGTKNATAKCDQNYGFGKLQAVNETHLYWTWEKTSKSDRRVFGHFNHHNDNDKYDDNNHQSQENQNEDYLWIIQENHKMSYSFLKIAMDFHYKIETISFYLSYRLLVMDLHMA